MDTIEMKKQQLDDLKKLKEQNVSQMQKFF